MFTDYIYDWHQTELVKALACQCFILWFCGLQCRNFVWPFNDLCIHLSACKGWGGIEHATWCRPSLVQLQAWFHLYAATNLYAATLKWSEHFKCNDFMIRILEISIYEELFRPTLLTTFTTLGYQTKHGWVWLLTVINHTPLYVIAVGIWICTRHVKI